MSGFSRHFLQSIPAILPLLLVTVTPSAAHPPGNVRLAQIERKIRERTADARLFLDRADVLCSLRRWPAAFADYRRARRLDPRLDATLLARGLCRLESGDAPQALLDLDRYVAGHPDDAAANLGRARAHSRLGHVQQAADAYARATTGPGPTSPDIFLEHARFLLAQGQVEAALTTLDRGLAGRAPPPALQLEAVAAEERRGRYEAALRRIDLLLAQSPRQPSWLIRRAELLEAAGRITDARDGFEHAAQLIARQPPMQRRLAPIQALLARADAGRRRTATASASRAQENARIGGD